MTQMVQACLAAAPADGRPIELSFTGEGEAVLNWRQTREVCQRLPGISANFNSVRYCFSGLGAAALLSKLDPGPYPMRLQFSLHAARQAVRDRLIPRSAPLDEIESAMRAAAHRFVRIELNVVLQNGVNDSPEDLAALCAWGDPAWAVVLNPLLQERDAPEATETDSFERGLIGAGRKVSRYSKIGRGIRERTIYPLLSARKYQLSLADVAQKQYTC
jgi:adenine C2-methylase RlmN of 23S rRNA A2503 and tRNA A37